MLFDLLARCVTEERCRLCSRIVPTPSVPAYLSLMSDRRARASIRESYPTSCLCNRCYLKIKATRSTIRKFDLGAERSLIACGRLPYEGSVNSLIYKMKYDADLLLVDDLYPFLQDAVEQIADAENLEDFVLVPVPLFWMRWYRRGFNQAELLCRKISKELGVKTNSKALKRIRATRTQHDLKKEERRSNLSGAFLASQNEVRHQSIVLVDDVLTSGSTLTECARVLLDAGARQVCGATIAYARLQNQLS